MNKTLIKTDKNGTKYFREECKCTKCGGTGTYRWGACINGNYMFSGVCYDCGGSGFTVETTKEYTDEHRAKLDAQRAKRQQARDEEREAAAAEPSILDGCYM